MFAYVLAGIWVGRFFLYIGLGATALIVDRFYLTGDVVHALACLRRSAVG